MQRIALLSMFLALGLIFVQPLQADTVAYTIQTNLSPSGIDRLGVGLGTATAILNLTVADPSVSTYNTSNDSIAYYGISSATLTLSGTNSDGIYIYFSGDTYSNASLCNEFSTSLSPYDGFVNGITFTIAGHKYAFSSFVDFSKLFWGDNETPSLKVFSQDDITLMNAGLESVTDSGCLDRSYGAMYDGINVTATSYGVGPLPPSVWLLCSGLVGLAGWRRFRKS